jgi:DNA-binding transcriptional LysR family regulator
VVWRDKLVWVAQEGWRIEASCPVPLILYSPPSITRAIALSALERERRPWRIVCTSGSLSGLRAAALAGLGVTAVARGLIPAGLSQVAGALNLPDLGDVEFVLLGAAMRGPAAELAHTILARGDRLQRPWDEASRMAF